MSDKTVKFDPAQWADAVPADPAPATPPLPGAPNDQGGQPAQDPRDESGRSQVPWLVGGGAVLLVIIAVVIATFARSGSDQVTVTDATLPASTDPAPAAQDTQPASDAGLLDSLISGSSDEGAEGSEPEAAADTPELSARCVYSTSGELLPFQTTTVSAVTAEGPVDFDVELHHGDGTIAPGAVQDILFEAPGTYQPRFEYSLGDSQGETIQCDQINVRAATVADLEAFEPVAYELVTDAAGETRSDFGTAGTANLRLAAQIINTANRRVVVTAHTASQENASANQTWSDGIAEATVSFLVEFGADPSLLVADGKGDTEPFAADTGLNDRVELIVCNPDGTSC